MRLDSIFSRDARTEKKFLSKLFHKAKKDYPDIITFMDTITLKLEIDDDFHRRFSLELKEIFTSLKFMKFLTTSGLMQEDSLFSVLRKKFYDIMLPEIEDDHTLTSIVNDLFYDQSNFKNFKLIPKDRWERFYTALFRNSEDSELNSIRKDSNCLLTFVISSKIPNCHLIY